MSVAGGDWRDHSEALVRTLLDRVLPVVVDVADSAEVDEAQRLRYRTLVEKGWAQPEDFPDGRERDAHDAAAVHLVARDGGRNGRLVGTVRLVLPRPGHLLPLEEQFGLLVEPAGRTVDVGRSVVVPQARGPGHELYVALLARAWAEITARGFVHMCGTMADTMVAGFRQMGFGVEVLAPARYLWGRERLPVRVDGQSSMSEVRHALGEEPRG